MKDNVLKGVKGSWICLVNSLLLLVILVLTEPVISFAASKQGIQELPIYSPEYLEAYVDIYDIDFPNATKIKKIMKAIIKENKEPVYLKVKGDPKQYYVTNEMTELLYVGDIKKNRPHGKGKIYITVNASEYGSESDINVSFSEFSRYGDESKIAFLCVYMGEFEEGYYSGYGAEYILPYSIREERSWYETRDIGKDYVKLSDNVEDNVLNTCNPIGYIGEFKKGKYDGSGVEIHYGSLDIPDGIIREEIDNTYGVDSEREIFFYVGEYHKGLQNGKTKEYMYGKVAFSGEMNKGYRTGDGTEWYVGTDQIKYKGGWKRSEYHGKGTLYDEEGEVVYKGKWEMGDYAH